MDLTVDDIVNRKDIDTLIASDDTFAFINDTYGPPPNWTRPQGFISLSKIILAQQVSPGSGLDLVALVLGAGRDALARGDDGLRPSRLGRGTGAGRKADHHKKEAPHHLMFGFGPMATKSTARS